MGRTSNGKRAFKPNAHALAQNRCFLLLWNRRPYLVRLSALCPGLRKKDIERNNACFTQPI